MASLSSNLAKKAISGRKGGEGHTPVETPNNLLSTSSAKMLLALGEGEWHGGIDGSNIYLDGTPLLDSQGNENFPGTKWEFRPGSVQQTYIQGIPSVENELAINTELTDTSPWVRSVTNSMLSAVRLRLRWPALQQQKDNGDIVGLTIVYRIEVATDGGGYQTLLQTSVTGKTNTTYERSHRIDLPAGSSWQVRVSRITPNQNKTIVADSMFIAAITEVVDAKFSYPNTALLYIEFDAEQFNSIPSVAVKAKMRKVKVPTNYDPDTRIYSGTWDGSFKIAWTNNPAWISYDIILEDRFGTGQYIDAILVDKWELYQIAQYCDHAMPYGKCGSEPRFLCDIYIQQAKEAWQVLRDLAAIYRGMSYWANGQMYTVADMPRDMDFLYTNANVVDGKFSYTGTSVRSKFTRALVSYDDPDNDYNTDVTSVGDISLQQRFGDNPVELSAIGCTRESEAQRRGQWAIHTNNADRMVGFSVGLDGQVPLPGMIIGVADKLVAGKRFGGRIKAVNGLNITLDQACDAAANDSLIINLPSGKAEKRTITAVNDAVITVSTAYSETPAEQLQWSVESNTLVPQLFRVMTIRKADSDEIEYQISAVEHNPSKFNAIDNGTKLLDRPISVLPAKTQASPATINISQRTYVEQTQSVTVMIIDWPKTDGAVAYDVQWRKDDGDWVSLPRTGSNSVEVVGVYTGSYLARVRAINSVNVASIYAESVLTDLTGKDANLSLPTSLTAKSIAFGINLYWGFPLGSEDTLHTEIQIASDNFGSDAQKLVDVAYPSASYVVGNLPKGTAYYFRARLVDKVGNKGAFTPWTYGASSSNQSDYDTLFGETFKSYTWFAWADDDTGTGFTTDETAGKAKKWMGVATDKPVSAPSGNWEDYTWTKVSAVIGDLFTASEQQQLDNLMAGKLPNDASKEMLALQDALADPKFNNNLLTAQQLLNQGIDAADLGGETPAAAQAKADAARLLAEANAAAEAQAKTDALKEITVQKDAFYFSYHYCSAVILLIPYNNGDVATEKSEFFGQLTFNRGGSTSQNRTEKLDISAKSAYYETDFSMSKLETSWNWKFVTFMYKGALWLGLQSGANIQDANVEFWGSRTCVSDNSYSASDQLKVVPYYQAGNPNGNNGVLNAEIYDSLAFITGNELKNSTGATFENTVDAQAKANAAQSAAEAYALAKANLAEIQSKAYADGVVSDEEARAIADAQAKADAAKAAAISAAAADAQAKANAAQSAAETYALAKANLAETQAKAYTDGVVSDEEARAIADAQAKADAAKAAAISAAASDAQAKVDEVKGLTVRKESFSFYLHLYSAVIPLIPYNDGSYHAYESEVFGQLTFRRGGNSATNRTEKLDISVKTAYNNTNLSMAKLETSWNWRFVTFLYNGVKWLGLQSGNNVQDGRVEFWGSRTCSSAFGHNPEDQFKVIGYYRTDTGVVNAEIYNSLEFKTANSFKSADGTLLENVIDSQTRANNAENQAVSSIALGNFVANIGLISTLFANSGLFGELKAKTASFGGLTAETIASLAIATNHLQAGAVTADKVTADTALIQKLIASQGLFDELQARMAVFGGLSAQSIAAGAVHVDKLSVLSRELVNPVSVTKNLIGWGGVSETGSAPPSQLAYNSPENAIAFTCNNNYSLWPKAWAVNHDKIYRVALKIKSTVANGIYYIGAQGLRGANGGGLSNGGNGQGTDYLYPYSTNRVAQSAAVNVYFTSQQATTYYSEFVVYIVGANRDVNDCPAYKGPVGSPFIKLDPASTFAGIRLLNWDNGTTTKTLYIKDASVTEVGTGQIVADNIAAGAVVAGKIAANAVSANEVLADTALINKLVGTSGLFNDLVARLAVFGGLTANSIAAGAILGTHIKAGEKIQSPIIEGGQLRLIGSGYMKVQAATPFGPDSLVEWYGPKLLSGTEPNWGALKKSNAITYLAANGDAYFGGSLSAGILKTGVTNPDKNQYAASSIPVLIGPFGTNGKAKNVVVSYDLSADSTTSSGSAVSNKSLQWQLQRAIGNGSWTTVSSGTFTIGVNKTWNPEFGYYEIREYCHASSTYTDNSTSTSDFQYRLLVVSATRYHVVSQVSSQTISIVSTEQ